MENSTTAPIHVTLELEDFVFLNHESLNGWKKPTSSLISTCHATKNTPWSFGFASSPPQTFNEVGETYHNNWEIVTTLPNLMCNPWFIEAICEERSTWTRWSWNGLSSREPGRIWALRALTTSWSLPLLVVEKWPDGIVKVLQSPREPDN